MPLLTRLALVSAAACRRLSCLPAVAAARLPAVVHRRLPTQAPFRLLSADSANSHDARLSSLLESELRYERSASAGHGDQQKQRTTPPSPPPGFNVTGRQGTQFTLTRQCPEDGSLLEVRFDLNGSTASPGDDVDNLGDGDAEELASGQHRGGAQTGARHQHDAEADDQAEQEEDEEILSRPDVTFRVRKPSSASCLAVRCSFPPVNISRQMAAEDPDYPTFSIDTVAVETTDEASVELGAYELEADMLNDDLYKQLAEMLVHRGVTRDFENSLVQFCTAQEHQLYLRFLDEAKKFCDA